MNESTHDKEGVYKLQSSAKTDCVSIHGGYEKCM